MGEQVKTQLRIDRDLHTQVLAAATTDNRSLNGELCTLIELGLKARTATQRYGPQCSTGT